TTVFEVAARSKSIGLMPRVHHLRAYMFVVPLRSQPKAYTLWQPMSLSTIGNLTLITLSVPRRVQKVCIMESSLTFLRIARGAQPSGAGHDLAGVPPAEF